MREIVLFLLALNMAAFAAQKVAILSTEDDGEPPLKHQELSILTAKLRDIANKTLPKSSYDIMTEQSIQNFLGSAKEMAKVCRAADGCLAKIGKDIQADYIGQARISRFGKFFTIKMEVYDVVKGTMAGTFTDETSKDIYALLAVIDSKAPDMFIELHDAHIAAQALKESEKKPYEEKKIDKKIDTQIEKESYGKVPFWAAAALEAVGAGLILYGISKDSDVAKKHEEYMAADSQDDMNAARNNGKDFEKTRDSAYIFGALSLAAGIGVHIWF